MSSRNPILRRAWLCGRRKGIFWAWPSLNNMGQMAHGQQDTERALTLFEESLALREELGDKAGICSSCYNLAMLSQEEGDLTVAHAYLENSWRSRGSWTTNTRWRMCCPDSAGSPTGRRIGQRARPVVERRGGAAGSGALLA